MNSTASSIESPTAKLDVRAVLIADRGTPRDSITLARTDLEVPGPSYIKNLQEAIRDICIDCRYYSSPKEFVDCAAEHANDVVISVWSGERSRNRRALVPSICEAYGIRFVGGDAYTYLLCQDKHLSKCFAYRYGFLAPLGVLVEGDWQVKLIRDLRPPLVVKPNLEGGSIGISKNNLVHTHEEAIELCRTLLHLLAEPVLVEQFISGREVSIVVAGSRGTPSIIEAVEMKFQESDIRLEDTIFGYEYKKADTSPVSIEYADATDALREPLLRSTRQLFRALGKVDVMRLDGRINGGQFYLIELSPDVHLGPGCTVATAFKQHGLGYREMLRHLIESALS